MERLHTMIAGKANQSHGDIFCRINPANGEPLYEVEETSAQCLEKAISTAQESFQQWRRLDVAARANILLKAAELIEQREKDIARWESLDTGKPFHESLADVQGSHQALTYYAQVAREQSGEFRRYDDGLCFTQKEPLGVVLGIGAWNYPFSIACWKMAPALMAGNSMLFKPSELTSYTAVMLASMMHEAGLPAGVFNVILGHGHVGAMAMKDPRVRKISLTGSVPTGKKIMQNAAESLQHVTLELGGKSPLIIFDDADLNQAVHIAMLANFYTQGEICSNGTRVFVHENIQKAFLDTLYDKTAKLKMGHPLEEGTDIGALISEDHMHKVLNYIDIGVKEGAELLIGGERYTDHGCDKGYYVKPTVFSHCTDEMRICREEIFGPVMSVLSFTDETNVIQRANDTPFGLAAGVVSQDLNRAQRVANELEAGCCWINHYNYLPLGVPFGGYKQSGFGKENALCAIESFQQCKTIFMATQEIEPPFSVA